MNKLDKTCFQVSSEDNVAVILEDVSKDESIFIVGKSGTSITALDAIQYGHKIALHDIASGAPIIKYGICIGYATENIRQGAWVHLQNCVSAYDERSSKFDPHTGATHDTHYE